MASSDNCEVNQQKVERGRKLLAEAKDDGDSKWMNPFRPSFNPDWREQGSIHLDGEFDFDITKHAPTVAEELMDIAHRVGGIVTHQQDMQKFTVSAQFGALRYVCYYSETGAGSHEVDRIVLKEVDDRSPRGTTSSTDNESQPNVTETTYKVQNIVAVDTALRADQKQGASDE
jgi:hypothetical protein